MKLKPLHDWAVITRIDFQEKTIGGIIIPDSAKEKPSEGIVTAIGPGRYRTEPGREKKKKFVPTTVRPGQRVLFIDYMAKDIELDGQEITLIREEDILGTFEESGQIEVRPSFPVETKEDQPLAVQNIPGKAVKGRADSRIKTPVAKDKAVKSRTSTGLKGKSVTKKTGKAGKKESAGKALEKKKAKKTAKKSAGRKKTVTSAKHAALKKKKSVKKSTAKKTAGKKKTQRKIRVKKKSG